MGLGRGGERGVVLDLGEGHDGVAAAPLGLPHGGLGLLERQVGVQRAGAHDADADAQGRAAQPPQGLQPQALQRDRCLGQARVREQQGELVAAQAEGAIGRTTLAQDARQRDEHVIARRLPLLTIDDRELVEVDAGQGNGLAIARRPGDDAVQLLLERPLVAQTCEGVAQRRMAQAEVQAHQFAHARPRARDGPLLGDMHHDDGQGEHQHAEEPHAGVSQDQGEPQPAEHQVVAGQPAVLRPPDGGDRRAVRQPDGRGHETRLDRVVGQHRADHGRGEHREVWPGPGRARARDEEGRGEAGEDVGRGVEGRAVQERRPASLTQVVHQRDGQAGAGKAGDAGEQRGREQQAHRDRHRAAAVEVHRQQFGDPGEAAQQANQGQGRRGGDKHAHERRAEAGRDHAADEQPAEVRP